MKKISLLFLFSIIFFNAQTYDFNYLISYSVDSLPSCKGESVMYVSTKNDNYYLSLKKSQNVVTASLVDYQSKKAHSFKVKEINQKGEVLFDFQYEYTIDIRHLISKNEYSLVTDSASADPNIRHLELQVYKNSRRKKLQSRFTLEGKKSDNLFSAFEHCCIHPHQFIKKERPENILVTKATETAQKGIVVNYELKTLKKVNFQLIVPKELNTKYINSQY